VTPALQFQDVFFAYDGVTVLAGVDLRLDAGERLGLVGALGAGKTTLLHLAVGLLKPQRGAVRVFGEARRTEADFRDVRRRVGLVFQNSDDQLFCPTVLEDVAFGPLNLGCSIPEARRAAVEALERVGLAGCHERVTYRLSGGEKRLVALATVLAMQPEVLLLDEPQNGLDPRAAERISALLDSLPQSMMIVSNDQAFLRGLTSDFLSLEGGRLVAAAPPQREG
jgi:cobalt/nickel transport system ATP-binding protein